RAKGKPPVYDTSRSSYICVTKLTKTYTTKAATTGKTTEMKPNGSEKNVSERMYNPTPTIIEARSPYLYPFFQYSPITTGQINAASKPPNANKLSQMIKSGGFKERTKDRKSVV